MNLDDLLPVLDAISKLAEGLPYPYVALGGAVLAGIVLVLRKVRAKRSAAEPIAEVIQLRSAPEQKPENPAEAVTKKIVDDTLKGA